MHGEDISFGYGFWSLVVLNAAIFILFALSFLTRVKRREWRSFGVFTAFVVALFTEMYGFPLTPTIITAASWPVLLFVYYRLARREEREAEAQFGEAYSQYKASVPMCVPRIGRRHPIEGAGPAAEDRLLLDRQADVSERRGRKGL